MKDNGFWTWRTLRIFYVFILIGSLSPLLMHFISFSIPKWMLNFAPVLFLILGMVVAVMLFLFKKKGND